jgi:tetraacyldisaccharide-1-P 4'-kinase
MARASTSDPVLAVAGIASPANFFAALGAAGWNVADAVPFRDHHRYSARDLDTIVRRARAAGASRIVTTEKDHVRLLPFRPWAAAIEAVPMRLDVDDRQGLVSWLLAAARRG